jgi:hypothetical protein
MLSIWNQTAEGTKQLNSTRLSNRSILVNQMQYCNVVFREILNVYHVKLAT